MIQGKIRRANPLQAPYIQMKTKVIMPGLTNGQPNFTYKNDYVIAPSAKKIATYIVNQIFGSELVSQTEGLQIGWLMPTLKEALELSVYEKEAFIYLHKYQGKVYLECIKKCDIHNLVQVYDKVLSADIIQDYETEEIDYMLERHIEIKNGTSTIEFRAYEKTKKGKDWVKMSLNRFNSLMGTEYKDIYDLDYEVLINIDIGEDFFKDSSKLLNEEMHILNVLNDEINKTRTRIVTTQHYQTSNISANWRPASTNFNVNTIDVGNLTDYFTLLPGDREHQMFEFLQGDIRVDEYEKTFKFYDYQVIQMAGLSPATFGYEKDSYMNTANVDMSANTSEMTIEAIKTQIEPQIDNLLINIIKLQQNQQIEINALPVEFVWDYGSNERFDDNKKLQMLGAIQRTMAVPYKTRVKIVAPILNKLMDEPTEQDELISQYLEEVDNINVEFGEI